ncbi:hypothetical protein EVAR_49731_1 [Eumeta japonica]|uniref:Uncharacterized protein n=1 Tax=Eumeta variegata TaxID=151549 RepID=A0A4C1ZUE0_EUMVA|nr:hypothetical protein EVAR_49731_1 [Eumeta japonica]
MLSFGGNTNRHLLKEIELSSANRPLFQIGCFSHEIDQTVNETSNATSNKVALNVQRSWGGGIERDSKSECMALERMRVVYLLQSSASVSHE